MRKNCLSLTVISAVTAVLLLSSCNNADKTSYATKNAFAFDTYVSVTDYNGSEEKAENVSTMLSGLSSKFQSAYGINANTVSDSTLTECAVITSELNEKYGDAVNLTYGAVTDLWGISTDTPVVPDDASIENALETTCGTDYLNGDFKGYKDGTMLDFGSVAKGFACDRVYSELATDDCMIISLGSSTLLYGEKPDGSLFTAAVKDPENPEKYVGIIKTSSSFISTSGGYERYFEKDGVRYQHIIDVKTGKPVETDLTSVTVIVEADKENGGIMSDFLSTAIYAEGTAGLEKYLENDDFGVIAVDENKNLYVSSGVDFTVDENYR